jgi:hypothetical protein
MAILWLPIASSQNRMRMDDARIGDAPPEVACARLETGSLAGSEDKWRPALIEADGVCIRGSG